MSAERHDVLVVGGGPAGAAAGFWLAKAGHDVCVLERKAFPRDKTCGDGLTPRAVHQLREMGLEPPASPYKSFTVMGKTFDPANPDEYVASFAIRRA